MAPRTPTPVVKVEVAKGGKQTTTKLHNRSVRPQLCFGEEPRRTDGLHGDSQ